MEIKETRQNFDLDVQIVATDKKNAGHDDDSSHHRQSQLICSLIICERAN